MRQAQLRSVRGYKRPRFRWWCTCLIVATGSTAKRVQRLMRSMFLAGMAPGTNTSATPTEKGAPVFAVWDVLGGQRVLQHLQNGLALIAGEIGNAACIGRCKAQSRTSGGGFSSAVEAYDAQALAGCNMERQLVKNCCLAITLD